MEILGFIALGIVGLMALAVVAFALWLAINAAAILIGALTMLVGLFIAGMLDFYVAIFKGK